MTLHRELLEVFASSGSVVWSVNSNGTSTRSLTLRITEEQHKIRGHALYGGRFALRHRRGGWTWYVSGRLAYVLAHEMSRTVKSGDEQVLLLAANLLSMFVLLSFQKPSRSSRLQFNSRARDMIQQAHHLLRKART